MESTFLTSTENFRSSKKIVFTDYQVLKVHRFHVPTSQMTFFMLTQKLIISTFN